MSKGNQIETVVFSTNGTKKPGYPHMEKMNQDTEFILFTEIN